MTARMPQLLRETASWGGAATLVLGLHLGGALWLIQRTEAITPPGLPDPVFVELAPMPTAAAPPDEAEQEEIAEAAPEPESQPEPEPEPEPEIALPPLHELAPLPDMNTLFPPPPDAGALAQSARPPERPEPEPPEPQREQRTAEPRREETPRRVREKAAEQQPARAARTQLRAPPGERTAAPQAQAGAVSQKQVASWQSKVQSAVARHMRRTRLNGRGGTVTVNISFSVNPSGQVAGARLASSTGDARIDQALSHQAARLPRLPAPPTGRTTTLVLPVQIRM